MIEPLAADQPVEGDAPRTMAVCQQTADAGAGYAERSKAFRDLAMQLEHEIAQAIAAIETLPIDEASRYGSNKWQACALVRKLCVLKLRDLLRAK
jgi:hypothetical protein